MWGTREIHGNVLSLFFKILRKFLVFSLLILKFPKLYHSFEFINFFFKFIKPMQGRYTMNPHIVLKIFTIRSLKDVDNFIASWTSEESTEVDI